jgi:glycosyltransferase involved in cell wall biosynthesis
MSVPLISVVIPTRHRNDLLAMVLDRLSPGTQTLAADRYEVIVTDDGSDSTAEAMIREKYAWARWTAGPRKGPAANRNRGASLARGDWIAFTDDDCLPSPAWLAAFAAAIHGGTKVYEGKTTCDAGVHTPMETAPVNLTGGWLWSCNMMAHRPLMWEMKFDEVFRHPHMEDVYFRECLKSRGESFDFVPEAVVDHPPRRLPPGRKWVATHESEVIYFYKMRQQPPSLRGYLWRLAKARIRRLLAYRLSLDTLIAMYHATVEIAIVSLRYSGWKKQHRHLAR